MMSAESGNGNSQRVTDLESHLAHLQHFTDQLNSVVTEQANQLVVLQRTVKRLENQIKELRDRPEPSANVDLFDEKPPHY